MPDPHPVPGPFWRSDLDAKSHLDNGVVGDFEEIGGPARDPVQEREDRKRYRIHGRSRLAPNDRLMREVVVLVLEIGIESELVAVDQSERDVRGLHEPQPHLNPVETVTEA